MARSTAAALIGLVVALAACGEARQMTAAAQVAACARCHGDAEETSTGAPSQGAHATHVQALSGDLACQHCHPDPRDGATAHMNGRVDVVFGPLATHDAARPSRFDRDTLSCSAVYCHGAFRGGNEGNAPGWTSVGQGQAGCGTCHGLPPATTHAAVPPDLTGCGRCHASTVNAQGELIAGGEHLNGRIDALDDDCVSCHAGVASAAGARSSHLAGASNASSVCRGCHEASPGAHYRLPEGDAACLDCHGGHGEALGGRTPPLMVGWTDAVSGDFHGARTGVGFGGTLRAPYLRGQPSVGCTSCHDPHSSANAFLLAATVNGTAIPAAAIDRAGVGAEALCEACHEGDRHAGCKSCHTAIKVDAGDGHVWFDSSAPPVDPAPPGYPCFWCHGHEGIVTWTQPGSINDDMMLPWNESCDHCHAFRAPVVETVPALVVSPPPSVSAITATTATVSWTTNEKATSFVAYGVGSAGWIAGSNDLVTQHQVTLTDLSPSTTYVWRIRTSDRFRNVTETALQTFSTPGADEVPRPDLATVRLVGVKVPETTTAATLRWYPVIAPSGTAVEYEVQLASDPGFTYLADAALDRLDGSLATGNSGWIAGTPADEPSSPGALGFGVTLTNLPQDDCMDVQPNVYHYRVRARDALGNVSAWSGAGTFYVIASDPNC